jgi:hypothetical protein
MEKTAYISVMRRNLANIRGQNKILTFPRGTI